MSALTRAEIFENAYRRALLATVPLENRRRLERDGRPPNPPAAQKVNGENRRAQTVNELKMTGPITVSDYAERFGISTEVGRDRLRHLFKRGLVRRDELVRKGHREFIYSLENS